MKVKVPHSSIKYFSPLLDIVKLSQARPIVTLFWCKDICQLGGIKSGANAKRGWHMMEVLRTLLLGVGHSRMLASEDHFHPRGIFDHLLLSILPELIALKLGQALFNLGKVPVQVLGRVTQDGGVPVNQHKYVGRELSVD